MIRKTKFIWGMGDFCFTAYSAVFMGMRWRTPRSKA